VVRVVDHGPGIPRGERARAFRPFERLDEAPETAGIGLGLAVARGFVEAMDGELTVEDTPGGGLTMVVSMPRSRSAGSTPPPLVERSIT